MIGYKTMLLLIYSLSHLQCSCILQCKKEANPFPPPKKRWEIVFVMDFKVQKSILFRLLSIWIWISLKFCGWWNLTGFPIENAGKLVQRNREKNNNRKANGALKSSAFPTYTNTMIKFDESLSTHKYNSMRARMCGIAPVIATTKAILCV